MIRSVAASGLSPSPPPPSELSLRMSRRKFCPIMDSTWDLLETARRAGKRILFEGAQGALLDVDHGTYPFVTSSNTVAANAATGSGLGPEAIGYVLGIAKAYIDTRWRRPVSDGIARRDRRADRRSGP